MTIKWCSLFFRLWLPFLALQRPNKGRTPDKGGFIISKWGMRMINHTFFMFPRARTPRKSDVK